MDADRTAPAGPVPIATRVEALEAILVEKGYVEPAALDRIVQTYENEVGPRNGARVVARSWVDPGYRARLLADATAAAAELGFTGRQGEHLVAVENTPDVHHLVVCTLCSCYPWPLLGLPPTWYKSAPYRSRAVLDPRGVLADFGLVLPGGTRIEVHDSTAEIRYLVVPMRPAGTDGWDTDRLARPRHARLHDRRRVGARTRVDGVNGAQDLGGMMGFGPVVPEPDEPPFHAEWEKRVLAMTLAAGATGRWTIDASRHARECLPPAEYLSSTYYEIWATALERLLVDTGMVTDDELADGRAAGPGVPLARVLAAAEVDPVLAAGTPYDRPVPAQARFAVGDRVRTRVMNPTGHTRLPRYARGKAGVVERAHGGFVLPDTNAHGAGEHPEWVYGVRFEARELWGADADPTLTRRHRRLGELPRTGVTSRELPAPVAG